MHTSQISKSNKQLGIGAEKLRLYKGSWKKQEFNVKIFIRAKRPKILYKMRGFKDKVRKDPDASYVYHYNC